MHGELQRIFQVPSDKLSIIPNGISIETPTVCREESVVRRRYALLMTSACSFFVGRLVHEKGVDVRPRALPFVRVAPVHAPRRRGRS